MTDTIRLLFYAAIAIDTITTVMLLLYGFISGQMLFVYIAIPYALLFFASTWFTTRHLGGQIS